MSQTPSLDVLRRDIAARLSQVSDSPDLEARRLLEMATGLTAAQLIIQAHQPATTETITRLEMAVARRLTGEPLAYILGRAGFHAIELTITPDVLVPRPETETLVDATLAHLPADAEHCVADLGTGSGAIALALAHARPRWRIVATDAHGRALACARTNVEQLGLANVTFATGHWFEPLAGARFDAIVSNPPYIDAADPHLSDPALCHEPRHALVAADHGLADITCIAAAASRHLRPGGWLLIEHGHSQGPAVRQRFTAAGLADVATQADLAGNPRVTLGRA